MTIVIVKIIYSWDFNTNGKNYIYDFIQKLLILILNIRKSGTPLSEYFFCFSNVKKLYLLSAQGKIRLYCVAPSKNFYVATIISGFQMICILTSHTISETGIVLYFMDT